MPARLRELLSKFGISQSKLGELIGYKHSIISNWLSGKNEMPQTSAMAIQAALGVRWQWLLNGEGDMLVDEISSLTDEERVLLRTFRKCDQDARREILDQAQFNLGRSMRRWDLAHPDAGPLDWDKK